MVTPAPAPAPYGTEAAQRQNGAGKTTTVRTLTGVIEPTGAKATVDGYDGVLDGVYHRFNTYRRDGTLDRILERLQVRLDREGKIDWELFCIDGSCVRAARAAAGARKRGVRRKGLQATPWGVLVGLRPP